MVAYSIQLVHSQTSYILGHLLPVFVEVGVGGQGGRQSRRAPLPADLTLMILLLTVPDEVGDGAGVEDVLAVHSHMTSAKGTLIKNILKTLGIFDPSPLSELYDVTVST